MAGVTYDTGALIAGDRNDRRMWALHVGFIAEEVAPTVPAPVVAEAWGGGPRQASLARMLTGCEVEAMNSALARRVGCVCRGGVRGVGYRHPCFRHHGGHGRVGWTRRRRFEGRERG